MTTFTWKIKGITAENGVVKQAYYYIVGQDNENTVDGEGNWDFKSELLMSDSLKEEEIINRIKLESIQEDVNQIESRIEIQLQNLKMIKDVELPWLASTFTIE